MKIGESVRRHAPENPNRATPALPQACSGNLVTNPERAREESHRAPNATGPGLQKRMTDFGRRRQQCSERPLPIHQRERARGASAETAAHAAGTAGTTRIGASRGLESRPPVWAFQAQSELTPGYDILP